MKRLVIVLLLAALVAPVFADDALLIPGRVIRFRTIPSYTFASQEFNENGDRKDLSEESNIDSFNIWTLSFALEVGLTDQVTVAAQWTPGWQFASTVNAKDGLAPLLTTGTENAQLTGLNDLFLGTKILILGPDGFVPNDMFRFAVSLGGVIPLSIYDADEARTDILASNEYQRGIVGPDAFALGARLHFDYIVTPIFFVNLYSETLFYLPRDIKTTAPDTATTSEDEYAYGYQQIFELDPQVRIPVGEGITMSGSLAAAFRFTPDIEFNGTEIADSASQLLTLNPEVGALFTVLPVPLEAKLQYTLPLYGENANATNTIALQINTYLRY